MNARMDRHLTGFIAARCYTRAASAMMRCLSVCLSVSQFVHSVKMNKVIFKIFSQSGSHTILVFPYQTGWRYSDANAGGVGRNRDSEPISGFNACC